ncbi:hypothetical protein [Geothrix sp. PMB-07]|uniref:hypothetical protein n=1 Tax=Geothrix sp. PMB-07 TaxID=3068640 RepID=UPI0027424991|nr:hypothetical protein [Geothrix sp. PMB-07]WLT31729.1 hypothetical protein Q9293_00060 [Geothrix sp. PMB-07]
MSKSLSRLLRREQFAFLARDRSAWVEHLDKARAFLGEGLQIADPARPVLILGAGSGLEVPWALAPPCTTGWDADPWSRAWTALRHRRFPPWVFKDLTGGLAELEATARRAIAEPWSGHRRDAETAAKRLAGLLPFLNPNPDALRAWIAEHQPGTILVANVMGQFGVVAERVVEAAFGLAPWESDPDRRDLLAEAMEAWTRRTVLVFLAALQESGAGLWLVHDRAVVFGGGPLGLGAWEDRWERHLRGGEGAIEASDALAGVDVLATLASPGRQLVRKERWLWPVAEGQRHLIEALAICRKA